jgi:hypothetical protein
MRQLLLFLTVLAYYIYVIDAHGLLYDPAARSSAWRFDSKYNAYYNDMEMFCGGINTQWQQNGINIRLLKINTIRIKSIIKLSYLRW